MSHRFLASLVTVALLSLAPVAAQLTGGQTLVFQNFSQATAPSGDPPGWSQDGNGVTLWRYDNPGGVNASPPFSHRFAILDSLFAGPGMSQIQYLVSPIFDSSGCNSMFLHFDHWYRHVGGTTPSSARVEGSVDGGASWFFITGYTATTGPGALGGVVSETLNISNMASSNSRIRFCYEGTWAFWWAIDNVGVSCPAPGPQGVSLTSASTLFEGQQLVIQGQNLPTNPDDLCLVLKRPFGNRNQLLDLQPTLANGNRIEANMPRLPADAQNTPLEVAFLVGRGRRFPLPNPIPGVEIIGDIWRWDGDPLVGQPVQLGPVIGLGPTPMEMHTGECIVSPDPAEISAGRLKVTIDTDWGAGSRFCITSRIHAMGSRGDTRILGKFTAGGDALDCATKICMLLEQAFMTPANIEWGELLRVVCGPPVVNPDGSVTIEVALASGVPIDDGDLTITCKRAGDGTGDCLLHEIFLDGVGGSEPEVRVVEDGQLVTSLVTDPCGIFATAPVLLLVELLNDADPLGSIAPGTAVGAGFVFLFNGLENPMTTPGTFGQTVVGLGHQMNFVVPPTAGLAGQKLVMQAAAVSPLAANGAYATTAPIILDF